MNAQAIATLPSLDSPARTSPGSPPCWRTGFLAMLPKIRERARFQFRHLQADAHDEAVQEVVADCCIAYARLAKQGRADAATWSSLARYAVAHFRAGRRVGASLNVRDACSPYCQQRKGVHVGSLFTVNFY